MNTKHIYNLLQNHIKWHTKVLIAVSWWVDSMVLFDIVYLYFLRLGYNTKHIYIWHYNHAFRSESKIEQEELTKYFSDKNVNFVTDIYSGDRFDERSLRNARWNFFDNIINSQNVNYILTGHHLDDRIETSVINQIRGASIKWIINMQWFVSSSIYMKYQKYHQNFMGTIRPLIQIHKIYIYKYANDLWIKYREDHTNRDESISFRNYLRKQIHNTRLLFDDKEYAKSYNSEEIDILEDIYSQDISMIYIDQIVCHSRYTDIDKIYKIENISQIRSTNQIVYILDQFGLANDISQNYINDLWGFLLNCQSGYKQLGKITRMYICHGSVYLLVYQKESQNKNANDFLDYYNSLTLKFPEYSLRLAKTGDKFHGKSINEYLSNRKIPVFLRPYAILQVDQNNKIINIL